jgi:transketolase
VKICASHAGLTLGEDGATHQILEDIGLMRMLPGMTVVVPCGLTTRPRQATLAIAAHEGPVYLRFGRPKWPVFIPADMPFEIGKAQRLIEGTRREHLRLWPLGMARVAGSRGTGHPGHPSRGDQRAHDQTFGHGSRPSFGSGRMCGDLRGTQPVRRLGRCHRPSPDLARPAPQEYVAVNDSFGESGTPDQLLTKYGLDTPHIVAAAQKVIERK